MQACEECAFAAEDYAEHDLVATARAVPVMLHSMIEAIDVPIIEAEPVAATIAGLLTCVEHSSDGLDIGAVHECVHLLRVLSRQLHEAGAGAPTQVGRVVQLNTSAGGVPKTPVPSFDISRRGVVGDTQADRKHHGKPLQAVSLWSADVIDLLATEGHPVIPGAAGENVTIGGVDWFTLRPGVRILVGEALLELSAWATPCRKNDQWFLDRSDRIDHELHPGWSRAYAWVLEAGRVATDDEVVVEP